MSPFDLDAYLRRIGYDGDRTPTLATLRAIHALHPAAIPFENLDPLLRRTPSLDPAGLQAKLVDGGRGGWCYEHNGTLRLALDALGFRVDGLAGRVVYNRAPGELPPRTHMVLLVHLDEPWVVDVGFGGAVLTAPLRLHATEPQDTPHGAFRLRRDGGEHVAEIFFGGVATPLYRFDLQPQLRGDYEVPNWYLSTHPTSHFLSTLIAARIDGPLRYTLRNDTFTVRRLDGSAEQRTIRGVDEARALLADTFRIALPDAPELNDTLARFVGAPA